MYAFSKSASVKDSKKAVQRRCSVFKSASDKAGSSVLASVSPAQFCSSNVRIKGASSAEEAPLIRTFDEQNWAGLTDARTLDPALSLALLNTLHLRWTAFFESLTEADFEKAYIYPDTGAVSPAQFCSSNVRIKGASSVSANLLRI